VSEQALTLSTPAPAPPPPSAYTGPLAFCFVTGAEHPYLKVIFGPQGQQFTPIGDMPDGRRIGVGGVYPETLTIIKSAHPESFICQSWNELLTRVDLTPHVAWLVQLEDGTVKLERDLQPGEVAVRTPSGRHKLRMPPVGATPDFDPDYIPPVGTTRVVPVAGAVDEEQIVLSDAAGIPRWYVRATGAAVSD